MEGTSATDLDSFQGKFLADWDTGSCGHVGHAPSVPC